MAHLKKCDKKLGQIIDKFWLLQRPVEPDAFKSLAQSVVAQQISVKAAATVSGRLNKISNFCPQKLHALSQEEIKACGMSITKAGYIKNIAHAAVSGQVNFCKLHDMPDEEIIKLLTTIKGVGVWTAEMLLIFSLCRPNVISYGDLIIRRSIMELYGLAELSKADFEKYAKRYAPYASVASLYLWEMAH